MKSLRGALTALAVVAPSAALAHAGHGADAAHTHTEWFVVAAIAAVIGGATYIFKRNGAE